MGNLLKTINYTNPRPSIVYSWRTHCILFSGASDFCYAFYINAFLTKSASVNVRFPRPFNFKLSYGRHIFVCSVELNPERKKERKKEQQYLKVELLRENSSLLVSTNHAKFNKPGHEHEVYVLVTKELLNAKDHTTHKQTCARYEGRVFVSLQDHVEKKVGGGGEGEGTLGVKGMKSG